MQSLGAEVQSAMAGWAEVAQEQAYEWGWGMHPMWGSMWGWWGAWGIAMMLLALVFWGALIAAILLGVRWMLGQGRHGRSDPALDILRERYARGEIDREEFQAKKRDLVP